MSRTFFRGVPRPEARPARRQSGALCAPSFWRAGARGTLRFSPYATPAFRPSPLSPAASGQARQRPKRVPTVSRFAPNLRTAAPPPAFGGRGPLARPTLLGLCRVCTRRRGFAPGNLLARAFQPAWSVAGSPGACGPSLPRLGAAGTHPVLAAPALSRSLASRGRCRAPQGAVAPYGPRGPIPGAVFTALGGPMALPPDRPNRALARFSPIGSPRQDAADPPPPRPALMMFMLCSLAVWSRDAREHW